MIHVTTAGRGREVVLLHGLGATGASFEGLVKALAGRVRTHAIDLPGFGGSARHPLGAPAMQGHADAVLEYLDKISGPISLVGHSMGGRVALLVYEELAKQGKEGALGLIAPAIQAANLGAVLGVLEAAGETQKPIDRATDVLTRVRHPANPPSQADARKYAVNFQVGRAWMKESGLPLGSALNNHMDLLEKIRTDILYVWGQDDPIVPYNDSGGLTDLPKHRELVLIPDCGHIPHEERPAEVLDPIVDLLL